MARPTRLPSVGPETISQKRKLIERFAIEYLKERREIYRNSLKFKFYYKFKENDIILDGRGEKEKNPLRFTGDWLLSLSNDALVFSVSYEATDYSEDGFRGDHSYTVYEYYELKNEEVKKEYKSLRKKFIEEEMAKFPTYKWNDDLESRLQEWIENKKAKCLKFKPLYDKLVEDSKKISMTSTRLTEIEVAELWFKEYGIPYTPWEKPQISRTLFRETEKGECFSEEGEDEILEKILSEWGVTLKDIPEETSKFSKNGIEFDIKFKEPFGFKIWIKGDIHTGSRGLYRLKLKDIS